MSGFRNQIQSRVIIGGGASSGLFVYNGTPALGNSPQFAAVATGVTADPFGNAIGTSKILVQANVITESGGIFRTAAAAPLIQLDGPHDALFIYDAAAALIATISPAAGNDGLGNTFRAGIGSYTATQIANLFSGGLAMALRGATPTVNDSTIQPALNGSGIALGLSSGTIGTDAGSTLFLGDSKATNAGLQVVDGRDSNTYGTERLIQRVSPRSQSFSAVAAANIGGLSVPVVAGTYFVRARLVIEWNAAAGAPQMQFAGPAVSQFDVSFKSRQSGTSSTANTLSTVSAAAGNGTGYNAGLINQTGTMSGAGIFFDLDIWGMFVFTASGTLTLQAASSVAGDAWLVFSGFWEVQPL